MKFCNNCGTALDDMAVSCPACGAPYAPVSGAAQPAPVATDPYGYSAPNNNNNNIVKIIIIVAVVAVVIVGAIILLTSVGGGKGASSPEKAVEAYVEAINDRDSDKIVDICYPSKALSVAKKERNKERDDFIEDIDDRFDDTEDSYGKSWEIEDLEIKKVKDMKEDELEELTDEWDDDCLINISDAKTVKIEFEFNDKEKEEELVVVKYKGKWYIDWYGDLLYLYY